MYTRIICRDCFATLRVKAHLAGQYIKCPSCGKQVLVTVAAGQVARAVEPALAPSTSPAPVDVANLEIPEVILLPEDNPPSSQGDSASTVRSERDVDQAADVRQKPKRKKKKKRGIKVESQIPAWAWIVGCLGAVIALSGVALAFYLILKASDFRDEGVDWTILLLQFAVGMPISLVILVASMFMSSALGGGIDFGDIKTAITGALFLVFLVNLVVLIPNGIWLTFGVWLIGFMTIFGLDWWETRFLFAINFTMNVVVYFTLIGILNPTTPAGDNEKEKEPEEEIIKQRRDPDWKERDPAPPPVNPGDGDHSLSLNDIHEMMRRWINRQTL
jgi:hypothetical protein